MTSKPTWILAIGAAALLATSANSDAQTVIYGLGTGNSLVTFSSVPAAGLITTSAVPLTIGVGAGQTVLGIDFRPFDGLLYAVARDATNQGFLYTVDTATGAATPVTIGVPANFILTGNVGIDFNPAAASGGNALRVITSDNDNFRLTGFNVVGGNTTLVTSNVDGDLNPGDPTAIATAYTNNSTGVPGGGGGAGTTQYVIDAAADSLFIQNPPNAGTLAKVGTGLGVLTADAAPGGLDIVTTTNRALATLSTDGTNYGLYEVNLAGGGATLLGTFVGTQVRDLAVPIPEPASAVLVALSAAVLGFTRRRQIA